MQILFVVFSFILQCSATTVLNDQFEQSTLCDATERLNQNCMSLTDTRGFMDCAIQCSTSGQCTGFSHDEAGSCYLHTQCTYIVGCRARASGYSHYTKRVKTDPCQNGGVWAPETDSCACVGGWVGHRCEHLPRNCSDLWLQGYSEGNNDVTLMLESSDEPFEVRCILFSGNNHHRLVFLNTAQLEESLDKNFAEYEYGFSGWIGLKNMQLILDVSSPQSAVMLILKLSSSRAVRFRYEGFRLSNASDGYKLSYTSANTTIDTEISDAMSIENVEDCFEQLQGIPFSAFDQDRDGDPARNCALDIGNGWWFPDCTDSCNPFGQHYTHGNPEPYSDEYIRFPGLDMRNLPFEITKVHFYLTEI